MHTLPLMMLALVAPAKVSSVVVYPDRAQVTRVETVACTGRALAVFESVPPAADPSSFRARSEDATVESLVAEERTRQAEFSPELETLRKKRETLEREMAELVDARARGLVLKQMGESLSEVAVARVARELTEPKPDTRAWTQALDTALEARLRSASEVSARAARMREVQRELDSLRNRETFLSASAARMERRVEVRLACPSEGRARVELQYVVGGAGWASAYEARADEAGGQVELSTFATVTQTTGEDWSGVRLALSTARPRDNATPPELMPLTLTARERRAERKVLVRREEKQQHAQAGGQAPGETEDGALLAASQGISVQLLVPELAQVPGEGTAVRLRVARTKLKTSLVWRAVPKVHPVVFRVADLINGAPFPLLPGPVDVFRASGFIGRQQLEQVPQGGAFQITFGVEESLRVERVVVQEIARDEGLFGGRRRFHYAYRFDLANYRQRPEVVEVAEHIPVSELDDVVVELDKKTTPGHTIEAMDGIVTWKVKLAPSEKRSVDLAFHVDVPSSYDMQGL